MLPTATKIVHINLVRDSLRQIPPTGLDKLFYHLTCKRPVLLTGGIATHHAGHNATVY